MCAMAVCCVCLFLSKQYAFNDVHMQTMWKQRILKKFTILLVVNNPSLFKESSSTRFFALRN